MRRPTPVSWSTRRTEPPGDTASRSPMSRAAARSWARMIACTPEESQKIVDVRSAITVPTPGVEGRDQLLVHLRRSW